MVNPCFGFGVRSSRFAGRCGWRYTAFTITLTQIHSDLCVLCVTIGENLVFLRGFSENSFASLINRARARMAWLGLLRSPGRGIVQDRSA